MLLARGADPNCYWIDHWADEEVHETALYGAAGFNNHPGLTKLLLNSGAEPNEGLGGEPPYRGEAVYHACDHPGHNECLEMLLAAGASQAAKDYCLLRKLDFEDPNGVLVFIRHGANLNMNQPRTPLSQALLRGRSLDMIRLLLDHGADPNQRNADGTSPYVLARRYRNDPAANLLIEFGANTDIEPYDQFLIAAAEGDAEKVKTLANQHPEILNEFNEYGRQPEDGMTLGAAGSILHDLARAGQTEGLRVLIELGFDPGALNNFGESALHWACLAGRAETAEFLVKAGVPLNPIERNHGASPIGWACWGSVYWQEPHGDYAATVQVMLNAGVPFPTNSPMSPEIGEQFQIQTPNE